jgi:hypothetical protein
MLSRPASRKREERLVSAALRGFDFGSFERIPFSIQERLMFRPAK